MPRIPFDSADNEPRLRPTYAFGRSRHPLVAAPTVAAVLYGPSHNRPLRLRSLYASAQTTGTVVAIEFYLWRVSNAVASDFAGGTRVSVPIGRMASNSPISTARAFAYTANPTTMPSAAQFELLESDVLNFANNPNNLDRSMKDYSWRNDEAPMLIGPTEAFMIGFSSTTTGNANVPAAPVITFNMSFSEDPLGDREVN